MSEPDLTYQIERLISDVGSLRDDMAVLTAIVLRLDGSQTAMLTELRATHSQTARMIDRLRKLEEAP
jgi:hypothetical protein